MIEVHDHEQGSEAWYRARMGFATASEFATVLAKGRDGGVSVGRKTYMMKLAGEILTGEPMDSYSNSHMDRGKEMESAARELYAFETDNTPQQVGFVTNGIAGASPDSLIGADGVLEIKTKMAHLHIEALLRGEFPPEHKAQCQGQLWVCEREWVDLAIYWPRLPLIIYRAYRDEPYIATLQSAVLTFNEERGAVVERVKRHQARSMAFSDPRATVRDMLVDSVAAS